LTEIARQVHERATLVRGGLGALGIELVHEDFFDTVLARVPGRAAEIVRAARDHGVNLRQVGADHVGISCDETTTMKDVGAGWRAFGLTGQEFGVSRHDAIPHPLRRESPFLTHPVFHTHRSETAMPRYLRRPQDK